MTGPRLPLAPVIIDQDPQFSGFTVIQGDRSADGLDWGEMIALITSLTRSPEGGPRFPMLTAEEWEERRRAADEKARLRQAEAASMTTLSIRTDDLRAMSSGISDVLCWASGFAAANYDRGVSGPMGIEALRSLNIKIKAALAAKQQENVS